LEVTIEGLTDQDCSDCDVFNGTFILQWQGEGGAGCCWAYHFPEENCTFDILVVCLQHPFSLPYQLHVSLHLDGGGANAIVWQANLGASAPNCRAWSNVDAPVTLQFQTQCQDDDSTCTISAA
jgi:hypothetical protein